MYNLVDSTVTKYNSEFHFFLCCVFINKFNN